MPIMQRVHAGTVIRQLKILAAAAAAVGILTVTVAAAVDSCMCCCRIPQHKHICNELHAASKAG
jgi:hypothetical protein